MPLTEQEKINNLHKKSAIPAISNDYLPSASTVSGYFKEQRDESATTNR